MKRELAVAEFAEVVSGGTPSTADPKYWDGDVPWITPKDMSGHSGIHIERGERSITESAIRDSSAHLLPRDTVILSSRAPIGYVALSGKPLATNQGCKNLICRPDIAHPTFVYYLLKSSKDYLEAHATGSTYKELSASRLKRLRFHLPAIDIQQRVASILSQYDHLIENNRRRIALLEKAARLLYREWFIHFRFPGHEHARIIDGLPAGWEQRTLVELAEVVMGQSPQSKFYNEAGDGLPFHQGVTDYGFRFVSHHTYSTAITKLAEAGDILVSVRAPVGRINITREKIVLGRGLAALRSRTAHQSFLFYALKSHFYAENIIGTGAIYAATNKKELEGQIFRIPSALLLRKFEDQASAIDLQIACLTIQSQKLAEARDLLLPRLLNGEIAV